MQKRAVLLEFCNGLYIQAVVALTLGTCVTKVADCRIDQAVNGCVVLLSPTNRLALNYVQTGHDVLTLSPFIVMRSSHSTS
jgi:hypothetical protein